MNSLKRAQVQDILEKQLGSRPFILESIHDEINEFLVKVYDLHEVEEMLQVQDAIAIADEISTKVDGPNLVPVLFQCSFPESLDGVCEPKVEFIIHQCDKMQCTLEAKGLVFKENDLWVQLGIAKEGIQTSFKPVQSDFSDPVQPFLESIA